MTSHAHDSLHSSSVQALAEPDAAALKLGAAKGAYGGYDPRFGPPHYAPHPSTNPQGGPYLPPGASAPSGGSSASPPPSGAPPMSVHSSPVTVTAFTRSTWSDFHRCALCLMLCDACCVLCTVGFLQSMLFPCNNAFCAAIHVAS